jgi:hypothetical protein
MEAILTTPFPMLARASWTLAVMILLRAWWRRTAAVRSTMDGPQMLLAGALSLLPDRRRDWGTAMSAELTHLRTSSSRWRFALGCARVALFPPRSSRLSVVLVGAAAVTTAVSAGLAVGRVLPALQVFAATFAALVGALATLAVGRSRRPNPSVPGLTVTAAILAGVGGCIAIFAYVAVRYPVAARDPSHAFSVMFAVVLTAYVWLALTPPRALTTSRSARRIGCGVGLVVFGLGYPLVAVNSYDGQLFYLLAGLFVLIPGCAAAAAAIGGTRRHGVQAAVWMGLVSGLLIFVVHMVVPILGFQIEAALVDDGYPPGIGPDLGIWLPRMLGRELGGGIFSLLLLPGWALFFGLVGGAAGAAVRRVRESTPRPEGRTISL